MWPDRVSNPGSLTYESGALPTVLRSLANMVELSCTETGHVKLLRHIHKYMYFTDIVVSLAQLLKALLA